MKKTPIAVFTYNRPGHARRTLDSLAACARLDECDIFIYSDAPRVPEHAQRVGEVRSLVRAWGAGHDAKIIEQDENLGLARSIVGGVTELCERFGRVIVVEDDLVLHPAFIHFMLSALDRYEHEERVAQVSGYMFPVENPEKPDVFFLPLTTTWGWGTWQRVWKLFDQAGGDARAVLNNKSTRRQFDFGGAAPYSEMLAARFAGKNQSWGILFYALLFREQKLSVFPRFSLVRNDGRDNSGVHGGKLLEGYASTIRSAFSSHWNLTDFPQALPDDVLVYESNYKRVQAYLFSFHQAYRSTMWRRVSQGIKRVMNEITSKTH